MVAIFTSPLPTAVTSRAPELGRLREYQCPWNYDTDSHILLNLAIMAGTKLLLNLHDFKLFE
jgi:hypothetical protein